MKLVTSQVVSVSPGETTQPCNAAPDAGGDMELTAVAMKAYNSFRYFDENL